MVTCTILACTTGSEVSEASSSDNANATSPFSVQALLLTQDFEFDPKRKDSVSGEYFTREKLSVPANLSPQNKWVKFEGPVLENDLVGYRFYLDSRHRFDIYGKRTRHLVLDTVGWNYHDISDWGADILKVGNSLGIGSPGIWYQDTVYTLSNYENKEIEVVKAKGTTATIRTTIYGLNLNGHSFDVVQDWTLRAGHRDAAITLTLLRGELPPGASFCTGVVNHNTSAKTSVVGNHFSLFTWGRQSYHEEMLGMAVVAQEDQVAQSHTTALDHLLIFKQGLTSVTYSFMSGWERDAVPVVSEEEFTNAITAAIQAKQ
jgi:hypothetical protein